jgi:hypothetical protein
MTSGGESWSHEGQFRRVDDIEQRLGWRVVLAAACLSQAGRGCAPASGVRAADTSRPAATGGRGGPGHQDRTAPSRDHRWELPGIEGASARPIRVNRARFGVARGARASAAFASPGPAAVGVPAPEAADGPPLSPRCRRCCPGRRAAVDGQVAVGICVGAGRVGAGQGVVRALPGGDDAPPPVAVPVVAGPPERAQVGDRVVAAAAGGRGHAERAGRLDAPPRPGPASRRAKSMGSWILEVLSTGTGRLPADISSEALGFTRTRGACPGEEGDLLGGRGPGGEG